MSLVRRFPTLFVRLLAGFALVAAATSVPVLALADDVVPSRVAPLVARILSYERTLASRAGGTVDIVVLHAGSGRSANEGEGFVRAFGAMQGATVQGMPLRVTLRPYSQGAVDAAAAEGADVVLICSGLDAQVDAIASQARRRHLLTVGVERAHASRATAIAVVFEEGRPKIIANLAHARAEGVQLSAQLLRLSEVL